MTVEDSEVSLEMRGSQLELVEGLVSTLMENKDAAEVLLVGVSVWLAETGREEKAAPLLEIVNELRNG